MTQPAAAGPTVRRIVVGGQLRRLREAAGISRERAGYEIRGSESKISRLELGRVSFKERDVLDLLALYGVTDVDRRDALVNLAKEANQPGWWHSYDDVLAAWFSTYVGLEEAASVIRTYEIQFVPGLLQTEDYARATIVAGRPEANDEEIERRVNLRMNRQTLLRREEPHRPTVWAVVDESALRRPIGGRKVMQGQIQRLLDATDEPNIKLQILPFAGGGHAGESGAFTVLRFPDADLPDIVYLEQLTSALYIDKRDQVDKYRKAMDMLTIDAQSPQVTQDTLRRILDRA